MTVGPIDWGAHAPETLEKVAAVFLSQDHSLAIRRTPSSGDGGVDVLVRDGQGWHVHQVKSFTGRMTTGRRSQVARSLAEVCTAPRLNEPITRWTLVVPIDPTSDEQDWFEELTAEVEFPCIWEGSLWWERMATRHSYVVDYYFRDGQSRVAGRVDAMTRPAELMTRPPDALDVMSGLDAMCTALDAEDPHYRYSFTLGDSDDPSVRPDGAVLLASQQRDDGRVCTVYVIPKHRYALTDSPITGQMVITTHDPVAGIDVRQQFEDFLDYGSALDIPAGALSGSLSAPGGLSCEFDGGSGRIEPLPPGEGPPATRIVCTSADGEVHEVRLLTTASSRGDRGGMEIRAADANDILRLHARVLPDMRGGGLWWNLTLGDVLERPVRSVRPLIQLFAAARLGGEVAWMEEHGATVYAQHSFDLPEPDVVEGLTDLVDLVDLLEVLQSHVPGTVVVPRELTNAEFAELEETVALIRDGEIRSTWAGLQFTLHDHFDRDTALAQFETGGALLRRGPLVLSLAGRPYDLGEGQQWYAHAVLADEQPVDPRKIAVVPGPDATTVQSLFRSS